MSNQKMNIWRIIGYSSLATFFIAGVALMLFGGGPYTLYGLTLSLSSSGAFLIYRVALKSMDTGK